MAPFKTLIYVSLDLSQHLGYFAHSWGQVVPAFGESLRLSFTLIR